MLRHSIQALLALLLLFGADPRAGAQSGPLEDLAQFPRASLEITGGKQKHHFDIWLANTPARQEQGLMFVRELPAQRGMLFPQSVPRAMSMWMKNTYIELDMLFIDAGGRVTKIVQRAIPQSLDIIDSGGPTSAVLEIRGGETAKLGLHVGDLVVWKTS